ncbi:MAG: hypothetical protein QGD94_06235, partial [Planctomycetia bacterium]|nr:hypothetical protein [Planctomycetia bacterium]
MVIISHYHEVACHICISLVFAVLMFWAQANTAGAESNTIPRDKNRDKEAVWAYKAVEAVGSIGSLQREPKPPVEQTKSAFANLINASKGVSAQS